MSDIPTIKVGHQGISGSFSEEALFNYFPNDVDVYQYDTFEDVFNAVESDVIHYGVVPIENSSTGAIASVYDALNHFNCTIVGETFIAAIQNLLAIKGTKIEDIKEVYSHPQGFEQSKTFLKPFDWLLIPYYNTAKSAQFVQLQNSPTIAAIASKQAAIIYDLEILSENINCNKENTTRFIIISKKLKVNKLCNKISVVFSTKHQAGALFKALELFAENDINLLKIESRPVKHTPWEYYFYVDFVGNMEDESVLKTVSQMKENCHHFKLLGNYKMKDGHIY